MAILDQNNVIFYHPLDDFSDTYLDIPWVGSGAFPSGKIENAFSPVTTDALSFGSVHNLAGTGVSNALCGHHCIAIIDETRFLTLYNISYDDILNFGIRARIGTITSSGVEFGSEFDLDRTALLDTVDTLSLAQIDTEKFIGIWSQTTGSIRAMTIDTSGTTVSSGVLTTVSVLGTPQSPDIHAIDNTRALASWSFFAGATPNRRVKVAVLEASGIFINVGTVVDAYADTDTGYPYSTVERIDTDKMIVGWDEPETERVRATIVNTSGLTATPATPSIIMANGARAARWAMTVDAFNPSDVLILSTKRNTFPAEERGPYATLCSVSGDVITSGNTILWSGTTGIPALASIPINPSSILVHRGKLADPVTETRRVNFDGNSITFGDVASTNLSMSFNSTSVCVDAINDNLAIVGAGFSDFTIKVHTGMVNRTGEIVAVSGSSYPSTSGYERITCAFWCRELLRNSSLVEINRGYSIFMDGTAFSIGTSGSSGAIWNDSGITDITSVLNNDDDNFVVLDFSHQGSGNWNLLTSLNGSGFVDQGLQNSGTQSLVGTSTGPRIAMGDGTSNMWIDELVLWAGTSGTFDSFTTEELQTLNDLADVRGLPMYYYTVPTDSIDLFIFSSETEVNDIDLFISGPNLSFDNIDLFIGSIDQNNDNINLFCEGVDNVNEDITLFISSSNSQADDITLFIKGFGSVSNNFTLTLTYPDFIVDDMHLFLKVPEPISNNVNLFIEGHFSENDDIDLFVYGIDDISDQLDVFVHGIDSENDSINFNISAGFHFGIEHLFIKGINDELDDGFGLSLDDLLRTGDFDPQIIGRFADTVTNVTIELWIIIDGEGVVFDILSDQCYEINSTSRWSWSTANIESLPYIVNQFVYRMTGNDNSVFVGNFILRTRPKNKRVRKTVRR